MAISVWLVFLCCNVLFWSAQSASASDGAGEELILAKLTVLQQKLDTIERGMIAKDGKLDSIDRTLKEEKQAAQGRAETIQTKLSKFEARLDSLEDIMRVVKAATTSTQDKLDELEKKLFPPENNQTNEVVIYKSCKEVPTKVSGKYEIQFDPNQKPLSVYCEQTTRGGGWIVFQNRFNGQVDFFRNWTEYRDGFGDLDGEFWLGLENVHKLTTARRHELLVEVKDYDGYYGYSHHDHFVIGDEGEKFKLKKFGNYEGTAGQDLSYLVDSSFSTKDRDNDEMTTGNCALKYEGAWWYYACSGSNLNGPYGNKTNGEAAMTWFGLKLDERAMSSSRMMIREVN